VTTRAAPVILVPLDGSELAEGALWVAARIARALRGRLRLVAVCPAAKDAEGVKAAPRDWRQYLTAKADEVATAHGTRCDCAVLHGWPPEAIARHLASAGCRVVIMTAHGQGGGSPSWIGSTAEGILARVSVPVLVLRPGASPGVPFQHVLVALDQTAGAATVLTQALLLGGPDATPTYTLVRVVEPRALGLPRGGSSLDPQGRELERRRAEAVRALERGASRLRKRGAAVTTHVVTRRNVANRLIELGGTLGCDAIVIGSQSPHAAPRLPLGKVADKVLRGAKQAVLVVPVARGSVRRPARGHRRRATATS
jgi:nucleotide-binding universal stress UspA family protein